MISTTFTKPVAVSGNELDESGSYFILDGNPRADPPYPDYFVAMRRLSHTSLLTSLSDDWSLSFLSELKRKNGVFPTVEALASFETGRGPEGSYSYLANLPASDALKLNLYYGNTTLSPRAFIDTVSLIRDGLSGDKDVFDGNGRKIESRVLGVIHDDLLGKVSRGVRGEFLDVYFLTIHGVMYLATNHILLPEGDLSPGSIRPLESHLTQSKIGVGINCNSYLDMPTSQGFPATTIKGGTCRYWAPRYDSFGCFVVRDGISEFNYGETPSELKNPTIGIRAVKLKR